MTQAEVENIARKVAEKLFAKLPCKAMGEKIHDHDVILNNGLKDDVKRVKRWVWVLIGLIVIEAVTGRFF